MFGTKITGKLCTFSTLQIWRLWTNPRTARRHYLTGVYSIPVFSKRHTVTAALFRSGAHAPQSIGFIARTSPAWKQICFRFGDLSFRLLRGDEVKRGKISSGQNCLKEHCGGLMSHPYSQFKRTQEWRLRQSNFQHFRGRKQKKNARRPNPSRSPLVLTFFCLFFFLFWILL